MEFGLLLAYLALGTMAVTPIYYGSFASVKWPKSKQKNKKQNLDADSSSEEEDSTNEPLTLRDAYLFPIIGAVTIVGVLIIKNTIGIKYHTYKIGLSKKAKEIYSVNFTAIHIAAFFFSLFLTMFYVATKNWIASNIFGLAFAFNAIQILTLDSFQTGITLLSGLFFYDIFWVFGTEVMVTVAKSFDAPIKVVWPKQFFGLQPEEVLQFTMLGLGDIVVPGIYVALCLRFDHSNYLKKNPNAKRYSNFPTPYFNTCITAYILGLVTTIVVMHTFKAAQPALLYLSPACIFSVLTTGLFKNQLKEVFNYSAEEKDEDKNKKDKKDKKDAKKKKDDKGSSESEGDEGPVIQRNIKADDKTSDISGTSVDDEDYN
ncbi:3588_t:CDS:2 [Diversispora eburnea]|uniref:3588_t:CDS:1 n=1 Tax=Diversispora eburnea TaxID=1213867 RepID=A0A9N9F0W6_9GLOM|nr:3588_t:CDS:2 [Diversispora eburnea]